MNHRLNETSKSVLDLDLPQKGERPSVLGYFISEKVLPTEIEFFWQSGWRMDCFPYLSKSFEVEVAGSSLTFGKLPASRQ